ncbi:MAG: hypothetical protein JWP44_2254 [Mucilaginibacter sp.]|nr:hypothetical protein [Mucilaginibacter sp.]
MNYTEYIEINPEKRFGRPIIIGTRISVYDVLSWLAEGMSINDIISDFPELNEGQIKACLSYAADKEHKLRVIS